MPITSLRGKDAFLEKSFTIENVLKEYIVRGENLSSTALRRVDWQILTLRRA